jgi:hypothetical protein
MRNFKSILVGLAILATVLFSCIKGDQGADGNDGNANVFGTNDITVNGGDWVADGTFFRADLTSPDITQAIVDKGIVMVYEKAGSYWNALPYTWGITSVSFDFGLNSVGVYYESNDGNQTANPGTRIFRIVSISALNAKAHSTVDWKNYSVVKETFNLPN